MGTGANLVECVDCGVRFYDQPKLIHQPAEKFYNGEAYDAYIDRQIDNGSPFMKTPEKLDHYKSVRNSVYSAILERLNVVIGEPWERLFEFGASWGLFLDVATRAGILGYGCDMSRRAVEMSGGQVQHCTFLDAKIDEPVDAVVSLDVIEHTETPGADLARAARILRPGGAIVVKTFYDEWHDTAPIDITKAPEFGLPGYLKAGYFGRSHLHHFTTDALRGTLERAGFKVVDTVYHEACGQFEMYGVKL